MAGFTPDLLDRDALDQHIEDERIPWIPQEEGRWFKPLHFMLQSGSWVNLVKMKPGRRIRRHIHAGGSVHAYVLRGSWRYVEHDWVARPGSYVHEPAGGVHTLEVVGEETMVTLFLVNGVIQYLDDEGRVVQQDDLHSRRREYLDFCSERGIEPVAISS